MTETPASQPTPTPKNFALRCPNCRWGRLSTGTKDDLVDLSYIKPTCAGCGKIRKYRCPKCGSPCPLKRIRGNS